MTILPTVSETLARTARKYPDREAIVYPRKDVRWTYEAFDTRVTQFANALRDLGVETGDRVSLFMHNSAEFAVAVYAISRAGAVVSPINYRLAESELAYILDDSDSDILLYEEATRNTVENALSADTSIEQLVYIDDDEHEVPDGADGFHSLIAETSVAPLDVTVSGEDPFILVYTSGTTGRPKGVVHTHEDATYHNILYNGQKGIDHRVIGVAVMPMYHVAELNCGLLPRVNVGGKSVILHSFDAQRILELVDSENVTYLFVASRTWSALLNEAREMDFDGSTLDLGVYGAAPMPPSLLEQCMDVFTDRWSTAYGMTEMGPNATFLLPFEVDEKLGSVGRPAPNHEVRIVEPTENEDPNSPVTTDDTVEIGETGEIILRGPPMMDEYWHLPDKTADAIRDGWFFTGDAGYLDEDQHLYLVDRIDDMIISGGENIYPTEVENVLYEHESVAEVAVIGAEDDEFGERVVAYVVASDPLSADDLDAFCTESPNLADFKRPREYVFVDELPKNPSGKIQKYKLRKE
jgi:fatty-acyl-CoA synthase